MPDFAYVTDPATGEQRIETALSGREILYRPLLNKGLAFSAEERRALGLEGLLPAGVKTLEELVDQAREQLSTYPAPLDKNSFLTALHDRNETVFYRLLEEDIEELLPIVYTPTAGDAIQHYSHVFRRPRGLFVSYPERARMAEIVETAAPAEVDLIVVTDAEGILGIGDQGVGGIVISNAKLVLYTALAGIHPARVLPVMLDVGTDNQRLLNDPLYLGWRHRRLTGEDYDGFVDEFVQLVRERMPNALLHWEDFGRDNARRLLDRYREALPSFNDDMQGTGAVTLAAILAGVRATGVPLRGHRAVILGGGTAGTGIADQLRDEFVREGLSRDEALARIALVDRPGLLTRDMNTLTSAQLGYAHSPEDVAGFARSGPNGEITLLDAVRCFAPTILIGTSTSRGAFNEEVVRALAAQVERPIIFPLSNPTRLAEADPSDLIAWTDGRALVTTGSPFPPVVHDGETWRIGQSNNALVYPGIGLGAIVSGARSVSDGMLRAAAGAVAAATPATSDPRRGLLPSLREARALSRAVGIAVAEQALAEGIARRLAPAADVAAAVDAAMWKPEYVPIVRPAG